MNLEYKVKFKSDIDTSQIIINEIIHKFDDHLCRDDIFDLRLILNELVSNSIIHGNKSDPRKHVHLQVLVTDKLLYLKVSDEGEGIRLKNWTIPDTKNIRGRGLLLVKGLTDTFEIIGSSVIITRKIK